MRQRVNRQIEVSHVKKLQSLVYDIARGVESTRYDAQVDVFGRADEAVRPGANSVRRGFFSTNVPLVSPTRQLYPNTERRPPALASPLCELRSFDRLRTVPSDVEGRRTTPEGTPPGRRRSADAMTSRRVML